MDCFFDACGALRRVGGARAAFYFYTPFPLITRQILALVVFSPVSALCPIFTEKCGGDTGMAASPFYLDVISVVANDRRDGGYGI